MKSIGLMLTGDRSRTPMFIGAVAMVALVVAVAAFTVASTGKSPAEADSLSSPAQAVPQDPSSRNSVFVQISSDNQGQFDNESPFLGREDWTTVLEYNHSLFSPLDAASGQVTGQIVHNAVVFTKAVDGVSIDLMKAMLANETIELVFEFEHVESRFGQIETYYKVTLNNARVSAVRKNIGLDGGDTETISIVYNEIIEEHLPTGETATGEIGSIF